MVVMETAAVVVVQTPNTHAVRHWACVTRNELKNNSITTVEAIVSPECGKFQNHHRHRPHPKPPTYMRHENGPAVCKEVKEHAAARAQQLPNARTRAFAADSFDSELSTFTTRNTGRRSTVEIDSAELGAQLLGHELMIAGATFDRHAGAVALMFGASVLRGMHLTHTIRGVTGIDLACNAGGEDQVLRIAHGGGQTLVTLH